MRILIGITLTAGLLLGIGAEAATFTVNSTADAVDAAPGDGVCATAGAVCTLRAAIQESNAFAGTDTVAFNIAGAGPHTIQPTSALPSISESVIIDGTTEPDFTGTPIIELNGLLAGIGTNGLVISSSGGNSTIRGLAIQSFVQNGILLQGGNNLIAGNYIGLDADGTTLAGNNTSNTGIQGGIRVESAANTIGGTTAADRNVISGNIFSGIVLAGAGASGNQVLGNYIGLDASGVLDRGNTQEGIEIDLANNNIIGGTIAGARNVISGNDSDGIEIDGADFTIVQGNYIGTDFTGTLTIGNGRDGIDLNDNGVDGATGTLIGGAGANEGNLIRGNGIYGIQVRGAPVINNSILGNQIYGNVQLGIDLNDDGITVNDAFDADSGPNDLLNFPVITSATASAGTVLVDFDLDVPTGDYRIEFFTNPSGADPSGNGEGEAFASSVNITHTGSGVESFSHSFAGSAGDILTATTTQCTSGACSGFLSTSEFSGTVTVIVVPPGPPVCQVDPTGTYIEAENFTGTIVQGTAFFTVESTQAGFNGSGYLRSNGGGTGGAPVHEGKIYAIEFTTSGVYNVWMRGYATSGSTDSLFVGLNGTSVGALNEGGTYGVWVWTNSIQVGGNQITVPAAGFHDFNAWIRENNHLVDGFYLTQGAETPTGGIPPGVPTLDPTACLFVDLVVTKSVMTLEDPVNATTDPKAIPGAIERYLVEVTNTGSGPADADTVFITDSLPAFMALRIIDYDGTNPGPVAFVDGSPVSGLSYTFTSLGSGTDDIEFSNDGGSTWTYTPVDSGDGTDPAVTDIRINPKGIFAGNTGGGDPNFEMLFKAVVQ